MQCILNVHVDVLLMSFGYPATLGALESDIYRVLLRIERIGVDNDCPNTVTNIRPHACIVSDRKRVLNISKTTTAEREKKINGKVCGTHAGGGPNGAQNRQISPLHFIVKTGLTCLGDAVGLKLQYILPHASSARMQRINVSTWFADCRFIVYWKGRI